MMCGHSAKLHPDEPVEHEGSDENLHLFFWLYQMLWFWTTTLPLPHIRPAMNRRAIGQHPINGVSKLILVRFIGRCLLALRACLEQRRRVIAGRSKPITDFVRAIYFSTTWMRVSQIRSSEVGAWGLKTGSRRLLLASYRPTKMSYFQGGASLAMGTS